jgi:coenzyme F420-0:L-glutamate ligase / coenzyme F420-1:gamma-L-glutamate ligase
MPMRRRDWRGRWERDSPPTVAARSFARITNAPVVIVVCLTLEHADSYRDTVRSDAEFLMSVQGTAMAAQNLMLAAHAEGLASCWMCAPLFCPDVVRSALGMPEHWQPQGLIVLGIAAEGGRDRPRRPIGDFVMRPGDCADRTVDSRSS